jgi:uncharacterized protein (TIGR02300 family)
VNTVTKQVWGAKRQCPECGARFYDLNKDPIVCPKCKKVYEPEAVKPSRRSRPQPPAKKPVPVPKAPVDAEAPDPELEEPAAEEEEEVLEDTSELGEDEDDVAEVIEKVDEGEER